MKYINYGINVVMIISDNYAKEEINRLIAYLRQDKTTYVTVISLDIENNSYSIIY